jgi:GAF domain-containing protein
MLANDADDNCVMSQDQFASLSGLVTFFLEEAIKITGSKISYLYAVNEAEDELIGMGWSKSAMAECSMFNKPVVYKLAETGIWGDALRERQPIITNDYPTCPKPTKKGIPQGHVPIERHMNIPVFVGDKIVAVTGVGNKPVDYTQGDVKAFSVFAQYFWQRIAEKLRE